MQVANLLTGQLAAKPGGYTYVFGSCMLLYLLNAALWLRFARGQAISLPSQHAQP